MGLIPMPKSNNPTFRLFFRPLDTESSQHKVQELPAQGRSNHNHTLRVWDFQNINHTRKSTFSSWQQSPLTPKFSDSKILE